MNIGLVIGKKNSVSVPGKNIKNCQQSMLLAAKHL